MQNQSSKSYSIANIYKNSQNHFNSNNLFIKLFWISIYIDFIPEFEL